MQRPSMPERRDSEFAALIEREGPSLASFVLALVGDPQAVEDLYQSTCLELWRIRRTFRLGSDFGAWSRTVARYQIRRHWEKTQREKLAQRQFFFWYKPEERRNIINELRRIGRTDLIDKLYGKR